MVNEIIIANKGGIILYYKNFREEEMDPDLISGFFAAIQQFAIQMDTNLEEIKLGNKNYTFLATDKFFLVIQTEITSLEVKKEFLEILKEQFENSFQGRLDQTFIDTDEFKPFDEIVERVCSSENLQGLITKHGISEAQPEEIQKSLLLLFNTVKKDLDKVIHALLLGDSVIVTGDKPLVKLAIDTLTLFNLDRNPEKIYWTKDYIIGDIIGGPPLLTDVYKTGVVVDLKNGKVIRGKSNDFCKKLLNQVKNLDWQQAEQRIKQELLKIDSKSKEAVEMITLKNVSSSQIDNFIADLELEDLEFLGIYTKLKHRYILKELTDFFAECQKKKSKILEGFQKQNW